MTQISHNCMYNSFFPSFPSSPHPIPTGHHRAPDWALCAAGHILVSCQSYSWSCMLMLLSLFVPLCPFPTVSTCPEHLQTFINYLFKQFPYCFFFFLMEWSQYNVSWLVQDSYLSMIGHWRENTMFILLLVFFFFFLTTQCRSPSSSVTVHFSLVTQSCPTLCDPMDCSMPGFPAHHQLLEFTQTHACWVGDDIQPSHLLSSPSPSAFNLSQHQGLFKWVSSSLQVAKVLEFQFQDRSFQWIFRTDFL